MITTTDFGTLCDGRTVRLYTLKNDAIELSSQITAALSYACSSRIRMASQRMLSLAMMILQAMWPMTPALEIMSAEAPIVLEVLHLH